MSHPFIDDADHHKTHYANVEQIRIGIMMDQMTRQLDHAIQAMTLRGLACMESMDDSFIGIMMDIHD